MKLAPAFLGHSWMDVESNNLLYNYSYLIVIQFMLMFKYYNILHKDIQILWLHEKFHVGIQGKISLVGNTSYY